MCECSVKGGSHKKIQLNKQVTTGICSNMKTYSLIFFTFLCINSSAVYSKENNVKYEDASKLINVWFDAQKDFQNLPSITGLIVKDQDIVWSGTFGNANLEGSVPSTLDTMTSICSTSKVFTATAIMKLVDEGKINLDDKVADILPKYSVIQKFPESGAITIRTLLSHSSGIPRDSHPYWTGPDHYFPTEDEMLEVLSSLETTHPVGSDISYSNINYSLLGLIIEEVTGVSYKNHIESSLFKPLNMSNSIVEMQSSTYGNKHAIGYTAVNRDGKRKVANFYQTKVMQPAAGISTTANDLAKFIKWQFRLASATDTEILQPFTLKSMHKPQAYSTQGEYDRGFAYEVVTDKQGSEWAMHGGTCPGYVNFMRMDVTNKTGYAVLANANRLNTPSVINGLIEILKRAESIEKNTNQELDLSQYTGFYDVNPWNSEYYVASWGNDLMFLYLPAQSLKYALQHFKHVEGDTFQLVEDGKLSDEKVNFIRDDHGKVVKVKNGGNYHSRINPPIQFKR